MVICQPVILVFFWAGTHILSKSRHGDYCGPTFKDRNLPHFPFFHSMDFQVVNFILKKQRIFQRIFIFPFFQDGKSILKISKNKLLLPSPIGYFFVTKKSLVSFLTEPFFHFPWISMVVLQKKHPHNSDPGDSCANPHPRYSWRIHSYFLRRPPEVVSFCPRLRSTTCSQR